MPHRSRTVPLHCTARIWTSKELGTVPSQRSRGSILSGSASISCPYCLWGRPPLESDRPGQACAAPERDCLRRIWRAFAGQTARFPCSRGASSGTALEPGQSALAGGECENSRRRLLGEGRRPCPRSTGRNGIPGVADQRSSTHYDASLGSHGLRSRTPDLLPPTAGQISSQASKAQSERGRLSNSLAENRIAPPDG